MYQGSACSFGANRRQARNDSRESAGAFCRLSATIPAARVQKEASGFSESLEGIFGEPQQGHTRRFTALPVTATWRTMPMVTRYSPRWHANQTRFYFSACEPSPPRPLRRGVRLSQSETWCR